MDAGSLGRKGVSSDFKPHRAIEEARTLKECSTNSMMLQAFCAIEVLLALRVR